MGPVLADATAAAQTHSMRYAESKPLTRFIRAFTQSPAAAGGGSANAHAYVRGLAAYCAYASGAVIDRGELGAMPSSSNAALGIRASRREAASVGRLRTNPRRACARTSVRPRSTRPRP